VHDDDALRQPLLDNDNDNDGFRNDDEFCNNKHDFVRHKQRLASRSSPSPYIAVPRALRCLALTPSQRKSMSLMLYAQVAWEGHQKLETFGVFGPEDTTNSKLTICKVADKLHKHWL
jgi:hypothetical protein